MYILVIAMSGKHMTIVDTNFCSKGMHKFGEQVNPYYLGDWNNAIPHIKCMHGLYSFGKYSSQAPFYRHVLNSTTLTFTPYRVAI